MSRREDYPTAHPSRESDWDKEAKVRRGSPQVELARERVPQVLVKRGLTDSSSS